MVLVESRLEALTAEAKEAKEKLQELEASASSLKDEVCSLVDSNILQFYLPVLLTTSIYQPYLVDHLVNRCTSQWITSSHCRTPSYGRHTTMTSLQRGRR